MKLRYHLSLAYPEVRKDLVSFLSSTIEADRTRGSFKPYHPNEHDDTYWTLDSGNDWKAHFLIDAADPYVFQIRYRYEQGTPKEAALAAWLKVRINAEVVS